MTRPFRIWDKVNNRFVDNLFIGTDGKVHASNPECYIVQYSTLQKDDSNTTTYDGDIILYSGIRYLVEDTGTSFRLACMNTLDWEFEDNYSKYHDYLISDIHNYKIIGNILSDENLLVSDIDLKLPWLKEFKSKFYNRDITPTPADLQNYYLIWFDLLNNKGTEGVDNYNEFLKRVHTSKINYVALVGILRLSYLNSHLLSEWSTLLNNTYNMLKDNNEDADNMLKGLI